MNKNLPIGIFDSGVGGLTVLREFLAVLPEENYLYFGDTARVPYGSKSSKTVIRFSLEVSSYLADQGIKLLVVACNSASALAIDDLRKLIPVPVIDVINPGVSKAINMTNNGKIGIIGTSATIASGAYEQVLRKINSKIKTISRPCPLFVPFAEENWIKHPACKLVAEEYLETFRNNKVDVLILGCTHYPILKDVISEVMGPEVTLVDSAESTAMEAADILSQNDIAARENNSPFLKFFVSDLTANFRKIGEQFLGRTMENITNVPVEKLEKYKTVKKQEIDKRTKDKN
ncbi:MAG: glutamate racemase [Candidatus Theseobacter exili]|nr:glutamate racemase [Candidatus Theseobacter exili]